MPHLNMNEITTRFSSYAQTKQELGIPPSSFGDFVCSIVFSEEEIKTKKSDAPEPLPLRRKRALTLPLPASEHGKNLLERRLVKPRQRTSHQSGSPLFKLPRELRDMIWEYAVGGETLHIVSGQPRCRTKRNFCLQRVREIFPRLAVVKCHDDGCPRPKDNVDNCCLLREGNFCGSCKANWCPRCGGIFDKWGELTREGSSSGTEESKIWTPLALLLTCRRTYSEAIKLLYSTNTFHFSAMEQPMNLRATILPRRLAAIRHIHLDAVFPPRRASRWAESLDAVSQMEGLRTVTISLGFLLDYPRARAESTLLSEWATMFGPLLTFVQTMSRRRVIVFIKTSWNEFVWERGILKLPRGVTVIRPDDREFAEV